MSSQRESGGLMDGQTPGRSRSKTSRGAGGRESARKVHLPSPARSRLIPRLCNASIIASTKALEPL